MINTTWQITLYFNDNENDQWYVIQEFRLCKNLWCCNVFFFILMNQVPRSAPCHLLISVTYKQTDIKRGVSRDSRYVHVC